MLVEGRGAGTIDPDVSDREPGLLGTWWLSAFVRVAGIITLNLEEARSLLQLSRHPEQQGVD